MTSQDKEPLFGPQAAPSERKPSKSAEANDGSGGNIESTVRKVLAGRSV